MPTPIDRVRVLRLGAALVLGAATSWLTMKGGFAALRAVWPDFALAHVDKSYTLTMLGVRLVVFSSMIAAGAFIAGAGAR